MDLALFDFDGTITDSDMFTQFIFYATDKRRLKSGRIKLLPELIAYKLRLAHSRRIYSKMVAHAFAGVAADRLQQQGINFANEIIPKHLRASAMQRIDWHKQRGDKIVVVSASLDVYLQPWCQQHGLALLCTEAQVCTAAQIAQGKLTGQLATPHCSSQEKVNRIKDAYDLSDYQQIYAYGDTYQDKEMLSLADHRYYQYF
ncbi:HAD family hydrolase [Psychrobacter sp. I-STPA10]|uniref:HAD family hydrolase n=1 Tax=Psychrobacter sp. I-STPA10 TaxID=2585769 RepID=UPI001E4D5E71|nr:HAD family hydrolase [Psychrobacter sp. I-STPA10]